jgi:hypothetical protein
MPTDWSAPGTSALERLNDRRVRQFWDSDHLVAAVVKKSAASGQHHPDCCDHKGFLWDLAAAYPAGSRWNASLPEPVLLKGPVVRTTTDLESIVAKTK